ERLLGSVSRRDLDPAGLIDLPDDFAWEYFQAAPADQRVPFLRGDEWIVMDGLHPERTRQRTRLPGASGIARVYGLGRWGVPEGQPLALHADILRIDADAGRCSRTFRATFPVHDEAALASVRVVAGLELPGSPVTWPDPASLAAVETPTMERRRLELTSQQFESVAGDVL